MKTHTLASILSFIFLLSSFHLRAQSDEPYVDYLPKYRNVNPNILLSRIDFNGKKWVMHFRYIATNADTIKFYGRQHKNAWVVQSKSQGRAVAPMYRTVDVVNIRINDQLKANWLPANQEIGYVPEKGDIVSCELHLEQMPHFIRIVDIKGGDENLRNKNEFMIADLMVKSKRSPLLGTADQMETHVSNFYQDFDQIKNPELTALSTIENEKQAIVKNKPVKKENEPVHEKEAPLSYTPKELNSVEDLECKERVILKNVYFKEETSEVTGRVQALKTIGMVSNYMRYFPTSKIILHGHTDVYGHPIKNLHLSKDRAMAVKRLLIRRGIDEHRVIVKYHGGEQPLPGMESGNEKNRRVEVEVVCEEQKTN